MARRIVSLASLLVLVTSGWFGLNWWERNSPDAAHRSQLVEEKERNAKLQKELTTAQQKSEMLNQLVKRLTATKRVAQVVVTEQKTVDEKVMTTLHFSELGRDGRPIERPPITIEGQGVHVDGQIIQFDDESVAKNDPLRGHSVILFHRVFGHKTSVEAGYTLDTPGEAPRFYEGADKALGELENALWKDFWKLAEDPAYRTQQKVKLAWGGSVYTDKLKVGQVYDLSLDPQGGLRMSIRMPGQ